MMSSHLKIKSKNKVLQKKRTMNKKNLMATSGVDFEKKARRNQNLPRTTSRWSRLSSAS